MTMNADDRLELFFSQSLDGFFFMMIDEPVVWDGSIDKERVLDYVFEHQRVTKVNDAMLAQYGATRESFLGTTPKDLFRHDLAHGRRVWREFFDRGRLHVETDERRVDGCGERNVRRGAGRRRGEGSAGDSGSRRRVGDHRRRA